jgi:hypothetical protein
MRRRVEYDLLDLRPAITPELRNDEVQDVPRFDAVGVDPYAPHAGAND